MNILITGVTETHINKPDRASSTKFVSIPELMAKGYGRLGYNVDHRYVKLGEDLSMYDAVFVYVYPLDGNAIAPDNAIYVLEQRPDAYICLDDWAFQKILPTWKDKIDLDALTDRTWIAPLFSWGNVSKMNLPVANILQWDPSCLYEMPPVYKQSWQQRKQAWYNASLSREAHEWASSQSLKWPIHSIGGKSLGQARILESDVVWQYGSYYGVLCPTYTHAGCGWWRVRYLHAAAAGCVLGGNPLELGMIAQSYSYTLDFLESLDRYELEMIAIAQSMDLKVESLHMTLEKLERFANDNHPGRS